MKDWLLRDKKNLIEVVYVVRAFGNKPEIFIIVFEALLREGVVPIDGIWISSNSGQ